MRVLTSLLICAFAVSGCAQKADNVAASYVSPTKYRYMSCDQIAEELNRVSAEVARVSDAQDSAATRDAVATGIGVVLFFPALLVLAAGDNENQLAQLKGEYQALDSERHAKRCDGAPPVA